MSRLSGSGVVCVLSLLLTSACGSDDAADADVTPDGGLQDVAADGSDDINVDAPDRADSDQPDAGQSDINEDAADTSTDGGPSDTHGDLGSEPDVPGFPACVETLCPSGYECFSEGCLPVVAAGGDCSEEGLICERGTGCVPQGDGRTCLRDGTEGGYCRFGAGGSGFDCAVAPVCDEGLACDLSLNSRGSCRPGLPVGALCGAWGDLCNEDAACVLVQGTRRCVADGDAGGACVLSGGAGPDTSATCSDGLTCSSAAEGCVRANDLCLREVATDGSCGEEQEQCPDDQTCVSLAAETVCRSPGAHGAACRVTGDPCDAGLVCGSTLLGSTVCMAESLAGESCGVERDRVICAAGLGCSAEHVADTGVCLAPGTGAGADCRVEEPRCDGDLQCSDFSRYRQTCRVQAAVGDTCDLSGIQVLCPSGTQCMPSTYDTTGLASATCVSTLAEVEPNPLATPTTDATPSMIVFDASLLAEESEDCYSVSVDEGEALFIEMSHVSTLFTASSTIRLWNAAGVELGRWTTSPSPTLGPLSQAFRLEPHAIPLLRTLPPDTYTVCVEPATGVVGEYRMGMSAAELSD